MLSFELAPGSDVRAVTRALRHFTLAESLGGIESLIAHPATMTHVLVEPRSAPRCWDRRLLRLSVGLEPEEDFIADLELALSQAQSRSQ